MSYVKYISIKLEDKRFLKKESIVWRRGKKALLRYNWCTKFARVQCTHVDEYVHIHTPLITFKVLIVSITSKNVLVSFCVWFCLGWVFCVVRTLNIRSILLTYFKLQILTPSFNTLVTLDNQLLLFLCPGLLQM